MELRGLTSAMLVTLILMSASGIDGFLDFTCFSIKARIDISGDDDMSIGGFKSGDDTDAAVTFERATNTGTSSGLSLPTGFREENHHSVSAKWLKMPKSGGVERIGAFNCIANENEIITTIIMSNHSTITPIQLSQTVSVGESVTFMVDTDIGNTRWRHNGDVIEDLSGQKEYTIDSVVESDAGVYECHQESKRDQGVHAIFLLVVRRCEQNKWNLPSCDQDCPYCFNGGICDERSGECVCAPGFSGQYCAIVHGRNKWGQDGRLRCIGKDNHGYGCQGKLFCLPHPYGCSCAAGFKGTDCEQECSPGTFGANCRSECHCKPGVSCLADTGECDGGECEDGWSGVNCQQRCSVTVLRSSVNENEITASWEAENNMCIRSSFRVEYTLIQHAPGPVSGLEISDQSSGDLSLRWSESSDNNCHEDMYSIQYKVINKDQCMNVEEEWESIDLQPQLTITLSDLVPYTTYSVLVTPHITDESLSGPAIEVVGNTTASIPSGPPDNIAARDITSNIMTLTWTQPKCGERRGKIIAYSYTLTDSEDNEFESGTISETFVRFDGLEPFTNYTFSISALTEKGSGPYVQLDIMTDEAAPSAPTNVRLKNITRTSMTATWGLPNYPNGILTKYTVQYHITAKPYDLSFEPTLLSDSISIDVSADDMEHVIDNLTPSTEYRVVVTAYSKKGAGEKSTVTEFTKPASSEDIQQPRKLSGVGDITSTTIEIQIVLSDSNFVTGYQIMVETHGIQKRQVISHNSVYIAAELLKSKVLNNPTFIVGDDKTYGRYHNKPLTQGQAYTFYTGAVSRINNSTFAVVWSDGFDVSVTPSTEYLPFISITIIALGCVVVVLVITVLLMTLKIRSLMKINKMLQNENSQQSKKSPTNTIQVVKSTNDEGTGNTGDVSISADGYVEYKVTKNDESTYQDLDNTPKNRQIDDGEEYAYVNESIVKSHTTERGDGNYESVK